MSKKLPIYLSILAASTLILGLASQWYVVTSLGAGNQTDAFFASFAVPQFIVAVVGGAITNSLVPVFAGEDPASLRGDGWAFFLIITSTLTVVALVAAITTSVWLPILFPGFDQISLMLVRKLTYIQLAALVFGVGSLVLTAVHHALNQFYWSEIAPAIATFIMLLSLLMVLGAGHGVEEAVLVFASRPLLTVVFLFPVLGKFCWPAMIGDKIRLVAKRARPLLTGAAYYKLDILLDRFLASMAPVGGLTLLYLAQQGYSAISILLNRIFIVRLLPALSVNAKKRDWFKLYSLQHQFLWRLGILSIGIYFLVIATLGLFSGQLSDATHISSPDSRLLNVLLVLLGGVLIGGVTGQVLASVFHATGEVRLLTKVGILGFTVAIPVKIVGFIFFGISGLAAAASGYYLANAFVLHLLINKRWKYIA